jgi:hypothetical protein
MRGNTPSLRPVKPEPLLQAIANGFAHPQSRAQPMGDTYLKAAQRAPSFPKPNLERKQIMDTNNNVPAVNVVAASAPAVTVEQATPAADKQATPFVSHEQWVASQTIDTSKNAPKQVQTPSSKARTDAKAKAKPVAYKKGGDWEQINYIVRGDFAAKLFAHTAAWLELTGLIHGKSAPATLIADLGGSALRYHTGQGNFETSQGMTKLTAKGMNHFTARQTGTGKQRYEQEDMEHYMLMMMEGIKDDRLIKSDGTIRKVNKGEFAAK